MARCVADNQVLAPVMTRFPDGNLIASESVISLAASRVIPIILPLEAAGSLFGSILARTSVM
jgi:hypothetical protein